jgi:hypothetical protein
VWLRGEFLSLPWRKSQFRRTRTSRNAPTPARINAGMPAKDPEEICHLFKQYVAEGDIESLLSIYDPEIAL